MTVSRTTEMPNVKDYIAQKRQLQNLESIKKNWEKKVEIMEMAARRTRSLTQKMKLSTK